MSVLGNPLIIGKKSASILITDTLDSAGGIIRSITTTETPQIITPLNVTSNGTYTPPANTSYAPVTVNVGASVNLQNKTVTPRATSQSVTADSGYDGLGIVTVTGDSNLIAGNIKKDVTIFGTTGTYEATGGSSYTLLGQHDFTVNTTSTSATSIGTMALGTSAYTKDSIIYVKVRDLAGPRNGHFVGSDSFIFNINKANGTTSQITQIAKTAIRKTASGSFAYTTTASTTGYGVYPYSLQSSGNLNIYVRYNSTNSLTLDGTYRVEVYSLAYAPTGGSPFDYSYNTGSGDVDR